MAEKEQLKEVKSTSNATVFRYGDKIIKVKNVEIDDEIDQDKLTRIDLNNLIAEIITVSTLVNRWGNILAETESEEGKEKNKFETLCALEKDKIRNEVFEKTGKKPTIGEVDDALLLRPVYKIAFHKQNEAKKVTSIVKSIYWAVKDKSDKLNKLSLTIQREDLESIQNTICNGVKIIVKQMQ